MSKQHATFTTVTGNSNVVRFIPRRNMSRRIAGLAIGLTLVLSAAATGMKAESAGNQPSSAIAIAGNPNAGAGFVYFPGQYLNQANEPAEHIQAF